MSTELIVSIGKLILEADVRFEISNQTPDVSPETIIRSAGLAGTTETAEILGVSKQYVSELHRYNKLPDPVARLRATPVWLISQIEALAQDRRERA